MICINRETSTVSDRFMPRPSKILGPSTETTVFCDLDGPLIDVSGRYYKTYCLAIETTVKHYQKQHKTLHVRPMHQERFWHLKLERIPDIDIAQMTGFTGEEIDFFLATVRDIVNQPQLLSADRLQPWAGDALQRLTQNGVRLALVTLRHHDQAVQMLKRFGIYHYFSHIQGSTDEFAAYDNYAHTKTAMLYKLMHSLGMMSSEEESSGSAWMIGDTEADILSAQAVGLQSIAVSCGMRSQAYLRRLEPSYIVGNLGFAADVVLKKHVEITA